MMRGEQPACGSDGFGASSRLQGMPKTQLPSAHEGDDSGTRIICDENQANDQGMPGRTDPANEFGAPAAISQSRPHHNAESSTSRAADGTVGYSFILEVEIPAWDM
jgi:hypothetical protein